MGTIIACISVFILCAIFGGRIVDFFCYIFGHIFIIAIHCLIGGAFGWAVGSFFGSMNTTGVVGFGIGCVCGFIWYIKRIF